MHRVVGVKFKHGNKIYNFDAQILELAVGDTVIVDSEQGMGAAVVAEAVRDEDRGPDDKPLKRVLRKATPDDLERLEQAKAKEAEAYSVCQKKILEREMVMKLVRVEWAFDNSKATFYFTADGRVDFRDLVRDLAHRFKIRIEMRQIGVRDEAKMIGGFGPCGRELCCSTFLRDFEPVSIKMAKKQDLVLNPAKISGTCGRLMCCLGYEYSFYDEIKKSERRQKQKAQEEQARTAEQPPEQRPEAAVEAAQEKTEEKPKKKRRAWRKKRGKDKEGEPREGQQPSQPKQSESEAGRQRQPKPENKPGTPGQEPGKPGGSSRRGRNRRGRGRGGKGDGGGPKPGGAPEGGSS